MQIEKNIVTLNPTAKTDTNTYELEYELLITEIKRNNDGTASEVPLKRLKRKKTLDDDPDPILD